MSQGPRRPTARGAASVLLIAALGALLCLLGAAGRVDEPTDLDNGIHAWVVAHRPARPGLTRLAQCATRLGDPPFAISATLAVGLGLLLLWRLGTPRVGWADAPLWFGTVLGGHGLATLLKLLFQRDRPPPDGRLVLVDSYSYPSGHSVFAAVFFAMLAALLARTVPARRRVARAVGVAACLVLALLVGSSRIWLGVHYPTDVLGGLLLGFAWVAVVVLARRAAAGAVDPKS